MKKQNQIIENISLDKLVHGGQCLAETPDGRKIFVWGGLPGEVIDIRISKKKSSYLEGIVVQVHKKSKDRVEPKEPDVYLSSSPWQIMNFDAENRAKQSILAETFEREGISGVNWSDFVASKQVFGYRNKVELGFWGDENGLHYASYVRGTHQKRIITENALALPEINNVMQGFITSLREYIHTNSLRAGDLKTVVFRSSEQGKVVAALFCKKKLDFTTFRLPSDLQGVTFYYSNPKSPASIPSEHLYTMGDIKLADSLDGKNIMYDVMSFFQVNVPVFRLALQQIKSHTTNQQVVDLYAGVGSIGLAVGAATLVEMDSRNCELARDNVAYGGLSTRVVEASSEQALEFIDSESVVIVDPPRAGLHTSVVGRIIDARPPRVVYLSCNPSTQARDVKLLQNAGYRVSFAQGYNFFPRTPHIESLIVLEKT